jgi:TonB-linked SusC/RagA family outer membrane protein
MQNIKYYMPIVCCLLGLTAIKAQNNQNKFGDSLFSFGYYSIPAQAVTTAVETVSGAVLERTSTADLGLSLAGRLNGLTTVQLSGELTNATVFKLIRGVSTVNGTDPLVIIDGVICPTDNWDYLTAQEIESISILKDGASTAIYGMQGSGGAIIITTKRGSVGKAKIEGYFDQAFQQNVYRPDFISSSKYVALRNQAAANDGLPALFSPSMVEGFNSGDREHYPSNDWYSMSIKDWAFMQRAGLNISGGNEYIKYFTNLNYMHQGSPIKIADEANRKYDPTPAVNSVNFRSNIDLKINDYLSAFLRLSGNVNMQKTSAASNSTAYALSFMLPPTMYGPLTGDAPLFNAEGTLLEDKNQIVTTNDVNSSAVYGMLNRSGYYKLLQTSIMAQSGLNLDMSFLTKGLSLSGLVAYQTYSYSSTATVQNFASYIRDLSQGYEVLRFIRNGSVENTPLVYGKFSQYMYNLNLFAHLDYNRTFGNHSISAMAFVMSLKQDKEIPTDYASRYGSTSVGADILPYKRLNSGITATYGYKDIYFIQASLGYTGSDQFARNYRYVATPAVSAAWVISNESFLKGNNVLTYLKLRASYGINANDQFGNNNRFMYLDEYKSDGTEVSMGNPYITAEKIAKQNYGFDLGLFKDFYATFDYYRTRTDNMLINGVISMPSYSGIPIYPKLNEGVMENQGVEASIMYRKEFGKDLSFYVGGGIAFNKNKIISINEVPYDTTYKYRYENEGFAVGQRWGYEIDYSNGNGFINTDDELIKAKEMYSSDLGVAPRLGDFIYMDANGDGKIDLRDRVPIGYSNLPQIYYNITVGFAYKGFEINAILQGTGRSSYYVSGLGVNESINEGYFTDIHLNSWTSENQNATYPALTTTTSVSQLSNSFFIMNTAYLRLRNLEVAYTLPEKISKHIAAEKIRIAVGAQNLFTVSKMRTKYIDPETVDMGVFQPYRVFNIKVNVIF